MFIYNPLARQTPTDEKTKCMRKDQLFYLKKALASQNGCNVRTWQSHNFAVVIYMNVNEEGNSIEYICAVQKLLNSGCLRYCKLDSEISSCL